MPEQEEFYLYNAKEISIMLDAFLAALIEEQDLETFNASCDLFETLIFRARERMAGIKSDLGGGSSLST